MISLNEIIRSLRGVWDLFRNERDGMFFFDVSVDGFWRSFQAILLMIPTYAIAIVIERSLTLQTAAEEGTIAPDGSAFYMARWLILVVDWVTLPVILAAGAKPLGFSDRYAAFIVARNWGAVAAMAVQTFATLFLLVNNTLAALLSLLALVLVLRYQFMAARHALKLTVGLAIFLVAFDFVLSLLIQNAGNVVFGLS